MRFRNRPAIVPFSMVNVFDPGDTVQNQTDRNFPEQLR